MKIRVSSLTVAQVPHVVLLSTTTATIVSASCAMFLALVVVETQKYVMNVTLRAIHVRVSPILEVLMSARAASAAQL